MKRKYTGSTDARGNVRRMGTLKFMDYCTYLFGVQSIGIYSDRGMRSDPSKSPYTPPGEQWTSKGQLSNAKP
jgi:hypothetical protein